MSQPSPYSTDRVVPAAIPEVCLCAALLMADGYIFRGHRHDDCYLTLMGYKRYAKVDGHQATQGFLTSLGRFVSRVEAAELQQRAGIVSPRTGGYAVSLTSEDLY